MSTIMIITILLKITSFNCLSQNVFLSFFKIAIVIRAFWFFIFIVVFCYYYYFSFYSGY